MSSSRAGKSSNSNGGSNTSINNPKLSLFHPRSVEQQQLSQSLIITPSTGEIQKKNSLVDDEGVNETSVSPSNSEKVSKTSGRWTKEEHKKFIEGIQKYGRNWKKVEEHIGTRTGAQIRSHAQKFFNRLEKEQQNNTKISDQSLQLLAIMNNSSYTSNTNEKTSPSLERQVSSSEKQKKTSGNQQIQKQNSNPSTPSSKIQTQNQHVIQEQQSVNHQNLSASINLEAMENINPNLKRIQEYYQPQIYDKIERQEARKFSDDFSVNEYLKEDSYDTNDQYSNQIGSNYNQFKILYDKALRGQSQHALQSPSQAQFSSKYGSSNGNSSSGYYKIDSPNPYNSYQYSSGINNISQNQYYNQNNAGYGSNNGSQYNYQQMKNFEDERDSEEVMEKYTRQIQENSAQENSFFIEHHLQLNYSGYDQNINHYNNLLTRADIVQPKLYDLCALGQQDLSSSQLNYQSESYVPNFKHKGRSRFGSFKLHDEENESSNQKYQNFRKASIDDQELKKKLKLNDGTSSFVSNSNKVSPDSQALN